MRLKLLAVFLILSFLIGYLAFGRVSFSSAFKSDIGKISMRHSGNGVLYSTTDNELIKQFVSIMSKHTYSRFVHPSAVGSPTIRLYDNSGNELGSVVFTGKGYVEINNKTYKTDTKIEDNLKPFMASFVTEQNIAK